MLFLSMLAFLLVVVWITSFILAFIHQYRIRVLREETKLLRELMKELAELLDEKGIAVPESLKLKLNPPPEDSSESFPYSTQESTENLASGKSSISIQESTENPTSEKSSIESPLKTEEANFSRQDSQEEPSKKIPAEETPEQKIEQDTSEKLASIPEQLPNLSLEQQFGARLPVWFGGIALVFAGFFLVKYSIDNNLLTPTVRVVLGVIFGALLLCGGDLVRRKSEFSNCVRISQSLSGAGISVLYLSVFVATALYQLIPGFLGFLGLGTITVNAIILSLRHGAPIAWLGLIFGFLTPALIRSEEPSALFLFIYLFFIFGGLISIARYRNWWSLSVPAILGSLFWVGLWITSNFLPADIWPLRLFLFGVSGMIVISSMHAYEVEIDDDSEGFRPVSNLNYLGLGGATILMGVIASSAGFGWLAWFLFGLLAIGGVCLAFFNDRIYGFVPFVSVGVNTAMLLLWEPPEAQTFAVVSVCFAILYIGAGYVLMWRARHPLLWAGLVGISSVGFYLLAFFKLRTMGFVEIIPLFWGLIAFVFAGFGIHILRKIQIRYSQHPNREYLLAIFSIFPSAFIAIGLSIELTKDFLPIALAAEMTAIALIHSRVRIKAFPYICVALAVIFGVLMLPQVVHLLGLIAYGLIGVNLQYGITVVDRPLLQFGLPAFLFFCTGYFLRRDEDGKIVQVMEGIGIGLVSVTGYYLSRYGFRIDEEVLFIKASFFHRGIVTNLFFVYGLICFFVGRRFGRIVFSQSGVLFCAIALFCIIYFDLLIKNLLWADEKIVGWLFLNSLLLPYGLPILWTQLAGKEFYRLGKQTWSPYVRIASLIFLFVWISLNVRFFFHGEYLNSGVFTDIEIYTYSVAWILLGIGLLLAGIIRKNKTLRYASLGIMIFTVGKVFLYDASELEGLYRVFSFLGLGLSLLALSWFYTRFVFGDNDSKNPKTLPHTL